MTLVVAQLVKGVIAAVSDTGITEHKVIPLPAERYVAKLCVLSSDTAIGFAGDPDYGIEAIETLPAPYIPRSRENPRIQIGKSGASAGVQRFSFSGSRVDIVYER